MTRTFVDNPAIRDRTPIMISLVGPSSSGKTKSALRVADGIRRVTDGEIYFVDTEARRALHYAEQHEFRHVPFGAPFSPFDYLGAVEYCMKKAAERKRRPIIIIDSFSHEHEGPGGVLEMHQTEHARLGGKEGTKLLAWGKPKAARRRLINSILQMDADFILCLRAKPKLKIERGKDPENLGYQAIGAEELIFEMMLNCLLLPGANGVPAWRSDIVGERAMMKLPGQFRALFEKNPPPQLSEDIGEAIAKWCAGSPKAAEKPKASFAEIVAGLAACSEGATFRALQADSRAVWSSLSKSEKEQITSAVKDAEARMAKANEAPPEPPVELSDEEKREIEKREAEEAKAAGNG